MKYENNHDLCLDWVSVINVMGSGFSSSPLPQLVAFVLFFFKAWPSSASLSPEGPPAWRAGPDRGRFELLMSSGGHRLEPGRKHRRVQGGEGHLEADSLVG